MKRFIGKILLFLLPVFFCLLALELGMRSVPNDYTYKNQWLTDNICHVRIWSFGSSHAFMGISPSYFSKPAFNSAHVTQSLKYDAFIFNKFIECADSLEWVILPISYFTMTSELENGEEGWRAKNYRIYYDCPYHRWEPKYNLEIVGNPLSLSEQRQRVERYWKKGIDDNTCDSLGFNLDYSKTNRGEKWYMSGSQRVQYHTTNLEKAKPVVQENIKYLESIVTRCKDRHVSVLLLTTPVCSSYYENVDSGQYALMAKTCESLKNGYDNVLYLNLFKDERFVEDDFFDADHLETEGAAKLTKILDEYIRNAEKPATQAYP